MNAEETINAIADRLVAMIGALPVPAGDAPVSAYKWATGPGTGFDSVPGGVVQIPKINRTGIDEPEDHFGHRDLRLQFEVFFVFDASIVDVTMPQSVSLISAFIDAVDADPSLSGTAQEAKVLEADPRNVETEPGSRALFGYACSVPVLAFL